ncbi:hypothetical protein KBX37_06175 [Micromonospora sp. U56]|uniref:hypothetical protein n=1 Tax=Micromonospora sp. U56 TaxID=2824900 RepID=UPI001B37CA3A|nr:hypothetical protein [Micromonospora sp. U56]MBQ0892694.1 hypothetical protein [Micromonospora sp. U56]
MRLYVMIHDVRRRSWVTLLSFLAGLAALCGVTVGVNSWRNSEERSQSDRTVQTYLDSLARGDYNAAHALVCTDETGVDRGSFEQAEQADSIRSFEIESSSTWSSWVDGHGRSYRVRVTGATGAEIVEVISTRGANNGCIQYRNIRLQ